MLILPNDKIKVSGLFFNDGHAIVFNRSLIREHDLKNAFESLGQAPQDNGTTNNYVTENMAQSASLLLNNELVDGYERVASAGQQSLALEPRASGMQMMLIQDPELKREAASLNSLTDDLINLEQQLDQEHETNTRSDLVYFSGAGLAYKYQFEALYIRFGASNEAPGSEHQLNSRSFPAELQLLAFNCDLYKSFHEASTRPLGLMAISVLIDHNNNKPPANDNQTSTSVSPHLETLLSKASEQLTYRAASVALSGLNISALLPDTREFVAYEGSLTFPGCHETVSWILMNKPLYVSQSQVSWSVRHRG